MDFLTPLLFIISISWICILLLKCAGPRLPPGPYGPPIIGNILHLGPKPHRSLATLARKYGPVMSLKLGSVTTVVFSSPDAARAALLHHDSSFSSRSIPSASEAARHHEFSMVWLPVRSQGELGGAQAPPGKNKLPPNNIPGSAPMGSQWRKLRKISKERMFAATRLDASQGLRREKLRKLKSYVAECGEAGRALDVGDAAFTTALNVMSASLFSKEISAFESESSQEMMGVMYGVMECLGSPNLADLFPFLKALDPQGILKRSRFYFGKLFAMFDEIIEEKLKSKSRGESEKDDLLEALIDLNQRDELSINDIKHLLVDLFVAGTDTTSGTVQWAMAELMRNPSKMTRLRNEIRDFIRENEQVQESDVALLPYLQAVVKETFRLHPIAPLLLPHKAGSDVEINGYIVPKYAKILINVWASGRDPSVWENADEFMPERFLNEHNGVDFKGRDFELIPFGAGRRICPGLPLADRMVHQMLVTLVGDFEWKLEMIKPEELDMDEKFGLTLQKATPLRAIPMKL